MNAGCFPSKLALPSFDEAMTIVAGHTSLLATESVPVLRAFGRIAAAPVHARLNNPPFDTSAMDGYAIAREDIGADVRAFAIGDDIPAGMLDPVRVVPGVVLPISTGARIPAGCDAVVPRERVLIENDRLWLRDAIKPGANIRRMGEDAAAGDPVIAQGHRMTPATVGALASYGIETVAVFRSPRIALFTTGDELGAAIPDANGPMIAAAIAELGLDAPQPIQLRDDGAQMIAALRAAVDADAPDIIISTGGVSVGAHDHVVDALRALGATIHFHGVAMRPGKPVLFASLPNGSLCFGLPGNPVAALLGFRFFVLQAIRTMLGRAAEQGRAIAPPAAGKPGMTVFLKASFDCASGEVDILKGQESHKLRPLISADSWVKVDAGVGAWVYPAAGML